MLAGKMHQSTEGKGGIGVGRGGGGGRVEADLSVAGRTQPAFFFRQFTSMYAWLQALLMVASVAVPITQHYVIVLHHPC